MTKAAPFDSVLSIYQKASEGHYNPISRYLRPDSYPPSTGARCCPVFRVPPQTLTSRRMEHRGMMLLVMLILKGTVEQGIWSMISMVEGLLH